MDVPGILWARLETAPRAVLIVDYDGTLAPFRRARLDAVPYPGVREVLTEIQALADTRVVVVTGRPPREAADLLALSPTPEIWGSHGWERMTTGGRIERAPLAAETVGLLDDVERAAIAAGWPDAARERKYASVALHWRDADDRNEAAVAARAILERFSGVADLELLAFAAGLEVRCRLWDKGRAVSRVLAAEPTTAAVAYLGDDRTDEDAFAVLAGDARGVPILVADRKRPSAAVGLLRPPEELLAFLVRWRDAREERTS